MPSIRESVQRQRKWTNKIKGTVWTHDITTSTGFSVRATEPDARPPVGTEVTVTWERLPTREEAVRQVIHDALITGESRYLGLHVDISTPGYTTADGSTLDPFAEIARRVLAALEETSD